jgi:hypothetical protein
MCRFCPLLLVRLLSISDGNVSLVVILGLHAKLLRQFIINLNKDLIKIIIIIIFLTSFTVTELFFLGLISTARHPSVHGFSENQPLLHILLGYKVHGFSERHCYII